MAKQMITDYSLDNTSMEGRADIDHDEFMRLAIKALQRISKENSVSEMHNIAFQVLAREQAKPYMDNFKNEVEVEEEENENEENEIEEVEEETRPSSLRDKLALAINVGGKQENNENGLSGSLRDALSIVIKIG